VHLRAAGLSEEDEKYLLRYYQPALSGDSIAQYQVAKIYHKNRLYIEDKNGNIFESKTLARRSAEWLEKSSAQGNGDATALLAEYYQKGIGVDLNYDIANHLLTQGATVDHPAVQYQLALTYLEGYGVAQDSRQGVELLKMAYDKEYAPAISEVCYLIEEGQHISFNAVESFNCYLNAASKDPRLGSYVGERYAFGHGTKQDNVLAYAWYALEFKTNGSLHPNDQYKYDIVKHRLGFSDRLESIYIVLKWQKGHALTRVF
jgi:TPR repeat protein